MGSLPLREMRYDQASLQAVDLRANNTLLKAQNILLVGLLELNSELQAEQANYIQDAQMTRDIPITCPTMAC